MAKKKTAAQKPAKKPDKHLPTKKADKKKKNDEDQSQEEHWDRGMESGDNSPAPSGHDIPH